MSKPVSKSGTFKVEPVPVAAMLLASLLAFAPPATAQEAEAGNAALIRNFFETVLNQGDTSALADRIEEGRLAEHWDVFPAERLVAQLTDSDSPADLSRCEAIR